MNVILGYLLRLKAVLVDLTVEEGGRNIVANQILSVGLVEESSHMRLQRQFSTEENQTINSYRENVSTMSWAPIV